MSKYFLDTEFHEYKNLGTNTIELISIGIVKENGQGFYRLCKDFDLSNAWKNDWLRENVLRPIYKELITDATFGFSINEFHYQYSKKSISSGQIASEILEFIGKDDSPEFYAYYADYDWVVFCWLFGRMFDLPKGFPMYCKDLKQIADTFQFDYDWIKANVPLENEHNALADAKWNLQLYNTMKKSYNGEHNVNVEF